MTSLLSKWKIALYLAAIFCAGGVSGWVIGVRTAKENIFAPPRPDEISSFMRGRLHKLNLTPEQTKRVDAIIDRSSREMQAIHGDCMTRIRQGINARNAQLNAVLSPEQQKRFEQSEKERREAWKGREPWHRGPRGPRSHDRDGTNARPNSFRSQRPSSDTNSPAQP